jgi:acetyl-CoA C-acetyltransferase
MNPNTPIIVGIGQLAQKGVDLDKALEPIELMIRAAEDAAQDTGHPEILSNLDSVRVVRGRWRYKQPAGFIANKLGSPGAELIGTPFGGNSVQGLVSRSALDILAGKNSMVLLTGAEAGHTQARLQKIGREMTYTKTAGSYDDMLDAEVPMSGKPEMARGIQSPLQMYPIFENAIRYQRGESISEHVARISELWAGFNAVAQKNPHAWLRKPLDAEAIRTPSESNRLISFPYPKLMNSNNAVDMSAALIMCSVEVAKRYSIDPSLWVFPWSGAAAHDTYLVSERDNLYSSPAIRIAGKRALDLAGLATSELDRVDVYSCFPSAVQVAATELGLDQLKPLTITGGLTFGGGPLNNYVMHSIARMVELARLYPDDKGLITANGGFLTKHAFGVYSSTPPPKDFQFADVQSEVDLLPTRQWLENFTGGVVIESYTVMYNAGQPVIGHVACLTGDGKRTWANTEDVDLLQDMTNEEFCGRTGHLNGQGRLSMG